MHSNNKKIKNEKNKSIKTKVGTTLLITCGILLFNLLTYIIKPLNSLLLGVFGLFGYALLIFGIVIGIMLIKNIKLRAEGSEIIFISLWLLVFLTILHTASTASIIGDYTFAEYLSYCYNQKFTAGGIILGLIAFPVNYLLTHVVATFIILAIALLALTAVLIVRLSEQRLKNPIVVNASKLNQPQINDSEIEAEVKEHTPLNKDLDELIVADSEADSFNENSSIILETSQEDKLKAKSILGLSKKKEESEIDLEKDKPVKKSIIQNSDDYLYTNLKPTFNSDFEKDKENFENLSQIKNKPKRFLHSNTGINTPPEKILSEKDKENLKYLQDITGGILGKSLNTNQHPDLYDPNLTIDNYQQAYNNVANAKEILFNKSTSDVAVDTPNSDNLIDEDNTEPVIFNNSFNNVKLETEAVEYKQVKFPQLETREPSNKKLYKKPSKYVKPTLELLKDIDNSKLNLNDDHTEKAVILENTLAGFNVPAKVVSITKGPAFTRFELQMQQGVSVKKITTHIEDIAMILKARGDIRMEIPIPGKNAFGVEVPNEDIETVGLKDIIESYNFQGSKSKLTFALGKDITGECYVGKVDKMPHLLIAGSTGSGKSVCLNSIIISLIYKASPEDLRLILIDPKRVEFALYNDLPHLLLPKVITELDKALDALSWLIDEMERRYNLFAQERVKSLEEYNNAEKVIEGELNKLPSIVFVIDELGDLMLQNKKEVEEKIIRITQKSRAAGIYLIIATQRPSVDVLTGTIKVNLTSRIAFAVSSFADSKTILDHGGAEKLLGKGDMLYSPTDMPDPIRLQGAFISNSEVEAVVEYVREHNESNFDSDIEFEMFNKNQGVDGIKIGNYQQELDPLFKDATRLIIQTDGVSTSKIQRAFGLGFPRAGKIVDQMEAAGFISAPDNKKLRTVFITQQEFEEHFGEDL